MRGNWILLTAAVALSGCHGATAPRDLTPPAAPRGVTSVTGDGAAYLSWLRNTEPDVAGYRIYQAPCASGPGCPYERIGSTSATSFTVSPLPNGVTAYFAVAAYDLAGNEGDLSYETVFDTPRPEGFGARIDDYLSRPATAGWDFSAFAVTRWDGPQADMFYGFNGSVHQMFVPDFQTDIQDAGWHANLDAIDFAPGSGWSPSGTVELIPGHCYIVWTRDDHYAKFRVDRIVVPAQGDPAVEFDWAYQVAAGNPELAARRAREESGGRRPITWIR